MLAFTRCDYDTADAQSMQSPGRQSRPPALSASLADGAFAAYECFALVQNLGAGRIYFARALQSKRVKPPNRRWNPKTALLGRAAFAACERFALGQNPGAGRIHFARALQSKWVKPPDGRRNPKRPFWAAPLLRRTSVLPWGKTSAQGEFTSPEHCNQMGGAAQKAAEPKTALLGRAAFAACERFALGQNLGAGRIHFARALQSKWVKPPDGRRNPQKRTSRRMSFFVEHPNTTIDAAASGLQSNQTEAQRSGFGLERRSDGMSER